MLNTVTQTCVYFTLCLAKLCNGIHAQSMKKPVVEGKKLNVLFQYFGTLQAEVSWSRWTATDQRITVLRREVTYSPAGK